MSTGAPKRNKNAEKHGLYAQYLPEETKQIMDTFERIPPIDILWESIKVQWAAIVRAQHLMYVKDQEDIERFTVASSSGEFSSSKTYEIHTAWDRHERFLTAQSRAMASLTVMIEKYEKLVHSDLATEEQRLRIEKLKAEIANVEQEQGEQTIIVKNEEEMQRWIDEHSQHS